MPVRIRLKRIGGKNDPAFRIVVADGRSPRDGRFIEEIGSYDPKKRVATYNLNLERAQYWISKGAQPSETVASFIRKSVRAAAATAARARPTRSCKNFSISWSKAWCGNRRR
jgi:small subunit ribosomal protein S16